MKIGILSDSHHKNSYQKEVLEHLKNQEIEYVIHAGDICTEENLKSLKEMDIPYIAVFGNNDSALLGLSSKYNIKKEPYYFKIKDYTFKLMHLPYYMTGDTDFVIFGHTHVFSQEYINNTLFLNPGEVCAREKPLKECLVLEINESNYIIHYHFKNINLNKWEEKQFNYEK